MNYGIMLYKDLTRAAIARNWHNAPNVKDHFLRACHDADLSPETAATLFRCLVKFEGEPA